MGNEIINNQGEDSPETTHNKSSIAWPIIAVALALLPVLIFFLSVIRANLPFDTIAFVLLSPIVGLVLGIAILSRGKARVSLAGRVLSIIAVIIPLSYLAYVVVIMISLQTGAISIGM